MVHERHSAHSVRHCVYSRYEFSQRIHYDGESNSNQTLTFHVVVLVLDVGGISVRRFSVIYLVTIGGKTKAVVQQNNLGSTRLLVRSI